MEYVEAAEARHRPGLRLALTVGVPGPWSEAAKYVFAYKGLEYLPVAQYASEPNADLVAWTGCRNAPVAVWEDEPGKSSWADIITMAERLQPARPLLPAAGADRVLAWGLTAEMAAETGFGWTRRLTMRAVPLPEGVPAPRMNREVMAKAYGASPEQMAGASERLAEILRTLAGQLHAQRARGSDYFVGDGVTAPDLYWAAFSQMLEPMPHELNPMPEWLRVRYAGLDEITAGAKDPILLEHRDRIFQRHLTLPLTY